MLSCYSAAERTLLEAGWPRGVNSEMGRLRDRVAAKRAAARLRGVSAPSEQSRSRAVEGENGSSRVAHRIAHESAVGQISRAVETVRSYQQRSVMLLSATLVLVGLVADVPELREGLTSAGCCVGVGIVLTILGIVGAFTGTALVNWRLKGNFEPTATVIVEDYGDDAERFPNSDSVYRELALHAGNAAEEAERQCTARSRWMLVSLLAPLVTLIGLAIIVAHG